MKMSNHSQQQQGVTLVEVLAGIVIISIIVTSLFSIITDSEKQYSNQSERNHNQQNVSYALKVLTKDIRQNPDKVEINSDKKTEIVINGVKYEMANGDLLKDSVVLANNISEFNVEEEQDGTICIKIKAFSGEEVSTQIAQRS